MIELTTQDGLPVTINPAVIWHVRPATGDQTAIYNVSGSALFVQQSYAEVIDRLRAASCTATPSSEQD